MAGEIQLNSTSFASESGGTITINNATLASVVDLSNHYASTSDVQGIHTTSTVSSGSASLTINSFVSGSAVNDGDYVVGEGITPGTTVSSGGGTTSITLSANAGVTLSSDPVSFYKADKVLSPGLVAGGLCRAWVNFNSTGTPAIRSSYNVTSITDQTDYYEVNFTTAMPDENYCITGAVGDTGSTSGCWFTTGFNVNSVNTVNTTTKFRIQIYYATSNTADTAFVYAAVFR